MKSTTSRKRALHPAKRGDVLIGSGSRENSGRTKAMSLRLSAEESSLVLANAEAAGMKLSDYCRDRLLHGSAVTREAALILSEQVRLRELITLFTKAAVQGELTLGTLTRISESVQLIENRVLVARALGAK